MRRFVATFFRHPFILITPAILIPIIIVLLVRVLASSYTTEATIFITSNPYVNANPTGTNPYNTPAQNLTSNITEFLQRPSFVLSVANATDMPKTYPSNTSDVNGRMEQRITSGLTIIPVGTDTLTIQYSDPNAHVAVQVITALLQQYLRQSIQDAENTAQSTAAYYQQKLLVDQQKLQTDDQAVNAYLLAHPYADAKTDSQLAILQASYNNDLLQVSDDQQQLQKINSSSGIISSLYTFEVTDPPTMPTAKTVKSKTTLTAMIGGVALGLGISLGLIGLMVVKDRRIYARDDLVEAIPLPVLEVIPRLRGLQEETLVVGSQETLAHLSQVPVLATLPRFAESGSTQAPSRTLTTRAEDEE